jgi:ferredoxin-NADP reductase
VFTEMDTTTSTATLSAAPAATAASAAPAARLLRGFLATRWLRPLNDAAAIDDLVGLVRPTFSLTKIRARVVAAWRETPAARTLVLEPNRHWPGHVAGQHVLVQAEILGRRVHRTFSIASAPRADGLLEITVKRRDGGHVSVWWNESARVGDVVTLSPPSGDFVLPPSPGPRLVMISAGSGITPVMAMLRALADAADGSGGATAGAPLRAARRTGETGRPLPSVEFVHVARSRTDAMFAEELEALASRHAWLRVASHFTAESGRFDERAWSRLARDAADAPAWVCGPAAFMEAARRAWREAGAEAQLRMEHFGLAPSPHATGEGAEVTASRSGASFSASAGQSLLEAAEAAGLRPQHGCRMGICHTCVCRRVSGTTVDLRDGRVSSEPGEMIQLCVSAPKTAVTLDL